LSKVVNESFSKFRIPFLMEFLYLFYNHLTLSYLFHNLSSLSDQCLDYIAQVKVFFLFQMGLPIVLVDQILLLLLSSSFLLLPYRKTSKVGCIGGREAHSFSSKQGTALSLAGCRVDFQPIWVHVSLGLNPLTKSTGLH
jgi:hypothetical protein